MIRDIFFDLDDTLLDFHHAESVALSATLRSHGLEPTEEVKHRYSTLNALQWQALERGETTRDRVKVDRFKNLFAEFGITVSPQSVADEYERRLGIGHRFIDGAPELLEALAPQYRLFIVSNGTLSVQEGRLASANISHYFDGIFISQKVGHDKPSRAFFEACLNAIGDCDVASSVIIGDSLTSDILGGINIGMRTIWFHPRQRRENHTAIRPDYELTDLSALPALLKTM